MVSRAVARGRQALTRAAAAYALPRRAQHNKEREELHRLQAKLGPQAAARAVARAGAGRCAPHAAAVQPSSPCASRALFPPRSGRGDDSDASDDDAAASDDSESSSDSEEPEARALASHSPPTRPASRL